MKRLRNSWLTKGLLTSIDKCHEYYKLKCNGEISYLFYKNYRNKLHKLIRRVKSEYFKNKFDKCINDISRTWKNIYKLLNKKKADIPNEFQIKSSKVSNPKIISDTFNSIFGDAPLKLVNSIDKSLINFTNFMTSKINFSIFVDPTTDIEVYKTINSFKNKNCHIDFIPNKIFKLISHSISSVIAKLFNQSILEGIFPKCLKDARIVPLYKSGKLSDINNYRPISTLSFLSKVFEKIMLARLSKFIIKNNILNSRQFGFQAGKSTEDGLILFMNDVYKSIDMHESVICTFIDFAKAFETIDHKILLYKLSCYGIRGTINEWFCSYLSNRTMYVDFKGTVSERRTVNIGVPQGTILGPILFLLYINDITNSSKCLKFILYADDTTVYLSGKNIPNIFKTLNDELNYLNIWTKANKISINSNKTKYMVISKTKSDLSGESVILNGNKIEKVSHFKFLGIILDENLNFKEHIAFLSTKISKASGILKFLDFLPSNILLKLYFSMVYPHFTYGILIWGSTPTTNLNSLTKLQKRIIRIITHSEWLAHTNPLYLKNNLIKIADLFQYLTCIYMFKVIHRGHATDIKNELVLMDKYHNYNTRKENIFLLPKCNTITAKQSILYRGPKYWNFLPKFIIETKSIAKFKQYLKNLILSNY